eukprot:jgi/Ulvmu1/10017/UM059_0066.1
MATEVDQTAKQLSPVVDCPYGVDRDNWCQESTSSAQALHLSIVVFGATGDLAAKKTFPALAALHSRGFLPEGLKIVGYGRSKKSDEDLRKNAGSHLEIDDDKKEAFLKTVTYCQGPYDEASGFANLLETLNGLESAANAKTVGRLFYLALPPPVYPDVLSNIKQNCSEFSVLEGDCKPETWLRVIIEKPFGRDLASSEDLSEKVASLFTEQQIYRIDHFLGKELTQNMLVMRFGNLFLSSVWTRQHIDNIQIVMKEAFGTEGRGGYFDKFGIIRDVIQNHLLQMLALLIMERPVSMHPDDIRDEKTKAIRSMRVLKAEDVVIGQYTAAGDKPGYKDDEGVPEDSNTPTYSVCRIMCDNERWEGVPMIIKAGKAMNETKMEVRVQFRSQPGFFGEAPEGFRNEFVMQLKPKDAMYMKMAMKKPGLDMQTTMSELNLTYKDRFDAYIPEAYERLILDAVQGNQQHFVRRDELRASWAMFTPILHQIDDAKGPEMQFYEYGSRAVEAGEKLIKDSGYVRSTNYTWKASSSEE